MSCIIKLSSDLSLSALSTPLSGHGPPRGTPGPGPGRGRGRGGGRGATPCAAHGPPHMQCVASTRTALRVRVVRSSSWDRIVAHSCACASRESHNTQAGGACRHVHATLRCETPSTNAAQKRSPPVAAGRRIIPCAGGCAAPVAPICRDVGETAWIARGSWP